ncbi:MAG: transglutaminase-like domain-containing protein [Prevotellaceae bacterium]|jgi:hypothetical protein|nr:transglutaminase-like domain-containing protein [Prevotellaceae bacterium]
MKRIILMMMFAALLPLPAASQTKTFKFSNLPGAETVFTLTDNSMEIAHIPSSEDHRYIMFNSETKEVVDNAVSFGLQYNTDDRHSITVYKGSEKSGTKWGWIYNGFYLLVKNGEYFFETPPVLEINKLIFRNSKDPRDFLDPSYGVQCDNAEIIAKAREITAGSKSDYEKTKAVHDWMATNIYYDWDAYLSSSSSYVCGSLDVLHSKKSVCQGYANLAAALLSSLNIPCRVVSGYGLGVSTSGAWSIYNIDHATNHAWNEVYVSGRWIIMDVTWDSDLGYRNGQFNYNKGLRGWRYFDPTLEAFSIDHKYEATDSETKEKAAVLIDEFIWQSVVSDNDLVRYKYYKDKYPNGMHIKDCDLVILKIENEAEDKFWQTTVSENTLESNLRYREKYPQGRYIDLCVSNIHIHEAKQLWITVSGCKNETELLNFLSKYDDCDEAELAKIQLSDFYEEKGDEMEKGNQWQEAIEFYSKAMQYSNSESITAKKDAAYSNSLYSVFVSNPNINNGEKYMQECRAGKYFLKIYEKLYLLYFNAAEAAYKSKDYKNAKVYYLKVAERERVDDKCNNKATKQLKKLNKMNL